MGRPLPSAVQRTSHLRGEDTVRATEWRVDGKHSATSPSRPDGHPHRSEVAVFSFGSRETQVRHGSVQQLSKPLLAQCALF